MPKKIRYITIPFYISSILYLLIIVLFFILIERDWLWEAFSFWESTDGVDLILRLLFSISSVFTVGFIAVPIIVASALKKRKRWAWRVSWVLTCMYLLSALFPLGISMLLGLLDQEVIRFVHQPRQQWDEAFKRMAKAQDDQLLDDEPLTLTEWNKSEWER